MFNSTIDLLSSDWSCPSNCSKPASDDQHPTQSSDIDPTGAKTTIIWCSFLEWTHWAPFLLGLWTISLFILRTCLKDVAVNIVFKELTCKQQNKEYLIALFRHQPFSSKQFLSEHFALWCMVAKIWYNKLCAVFFGPSRSFNNLYLLRF